MAKTMAITEIPRTSRERVVVNSSEAPRAGCRVSTLVATLRGKVMRLGTTWSEDKEIMVRGVGVRLAVYEAVCEASMATLNSKDRDIADKIANSTKLQIRRCDLPKCVMLVHLDQVHA